MKNKKILVIQLTRIGDLIQTAVACEQLRLENPNTDIHLACRKSFANGILFILTKTFSKVHFISDEKHQSNTLTTVANIISDIDTRIQMLNNEKFDEVVNLSFCKTSSILSTLVKTDAKRGLSFDINNPISINDPWSKYIYSNVLGTELSAFHLIDLYKNILGCTSTNNPVSTTPKNTNINKTIVIHPFTSSERKQWKLTKWVEVIYRLLKSDQTLTIKIVGAKNDTKPTETLLNSPILNEYKNRIQNLVGIASLENVYTQLTTATLFIGHDSSIGHLAALANTPSLTISLGTVRPIETSPYSNQAYIVAPKTDCFPCHPTTACSFFRCHNDVPFQLITSLAEKIIASSNQLDAFQAENPFISSSCNIYKSTFTNIGFYDLKSLSDQSSDRKNVLRTIFRIAWLYMLEQKEEIKPIPKISQNLEASFVNTRKGISFCYELAQHGKDYSRYIIEELSTNNPRVEELKAYSKKLDEIDDLFNTLNVTYPELKPIINYYLVLKGNLQGDNIVKISENAFYAYQDIGLLCSISDELILKICDGIKPTGAKRAQIVSDSNQG
jgi:ADP-heptose:LPS heptosyltransferase